MNEIRIKKLGIIKPNIDNPITDPKRVLVNVSITITVLLVLFLIGIINSVAR